MNELRYAYVLVHLFPDESAMNLSDRSGYRVGPAGVHRRPYDFNRLWITSGISNLGVPMAIFLASVMR